MPPKSATPPPPDKLSQLFIPGSGIVLGLLVCGAWYGYQEIQIERAATAAQQLQAEQELQQQAAREAESRKRREQAEQQQREQEDAHL